MLPCNRQSPYRIGFCILVVMSMLASLLGSFSPVLAAGEIRLSLSAVSVADAAVERTIDMAVMIDNAGSGMGIIAYQFDLAYDPVWLEAVSGSAADGDALASLGGAVIPGSAPVYTAGLVRNISFAALGGEGSFQGSAKLAGIKMKVKAGAPNGRYDLTLQNVVLTDPQSQSYPAENIQISGGYIQVGVQPAASPAPGGLTPAANLLISSITFSPVGAGETFTASAVFSNPGASESAAGSFDVSASGASPAQRLDLSLPSIPAGASATLDLGLYTLNEGVQEATLTVQIDGGLSKSAVYHPSMPPQSATGEPVINPFVEITVPQTVAFALMLPGVNTVSSSLNVRSNVPYQVDVFDISQTWQMREWDASAAQFVPGGKRLSRPLRIESGSVSVSYGSSPALIVGQQPAPDVGVDHPFTLFQEVQFTDSPLPEGRSYRLTLEFLAYMTL